MISPDGNWWWNGFQWVSAISPDGRWRWNGVGWVLNAAQIHHFARPTRLLATADTRRAQTAVVAYHLLALVVGGAALAALLSTPAYFDSLVQAGAAFDPGTARAIAEITFVGAAILGFVWAGLMIVGALLRWRWSYYANMVVALLGLFSILSNALTLAGLGSVHPPVWVPTGSIAVQAVDLALGTWLLVLWRRYGGAWGCRRVPA